MHRLLKARNVRTGLVVLLTLVLAVLLTRTAVAAFRPHLYAGTVLQGDQPAPPMDDLYFASGEAVDLDAYRDQVLLVYFGYTNCPDICPTTLSAAAQALAQLGEKDRARANFLMISVDPARDDAESLQEYVQFFEPTFRGATGAVIDIDRVTSAFGVYYELHEGSIEEGYLVDHTATLMGIGPDGSLRVVWSPDATPEQLADDIKELL